MNTTAHSLLERIQSHEALIGIIGLGYVGLPLALAFAEKGFQRPRLRRRPGQGRAAQQRRVLHQAPRRRPGPGRGRLRAALRPPPTSPASASPTSILICVPTPLTPQREPDMSYVVDARRADQRRHAARPARRPRVHHLPRHHRRAGPAHPRGQIEHRRRDTQRLTLDALRSRAAATSSSPSRPSARTRATRTSAPPPPPRWWAASTRSPATSPRPSTTRSSSAPCASPRPARPRPPS